MCTREHREEGRYTPELAPESSKTSIAWTDKKIDLDISVKHITKTLNLKYLIAAYEPKCYDGANIFIKSPMGSGKSTLIRSWIREQNWKTILYISARKTFSQDVCVLLLEFGFVSYEDIKGLITADRVIVQIDSVNRCDINKYLVVIVDEFNQILSHCSNKCAESYRSKQEPLIKILTNQNSTLIYLDAFMSDGNIEYVKCLLGVASYKPTYCIYNKFKPYEGNTIKIIDCSPSARRLPLSIYHVVATLLLSNKRVICPILSSNVAETLSTLIKEKLPNKTVYLYTGENSLLVEHGITMQELKNKHFSQVVKYWNEADCVIYTLTLSVGVDYSVEESKSFDTFVALYIGGDILADSFVLSLMRCRNYREKTHTIFMKSFDNIKLKRNFSPLDEYMKHGIDLQHDKLDRALDMFRRSTGN